MPDLTTAAVWSTIAEQHFAVVGMVSARGQARTAGIVYAVEGRRLYYASRSTEWKVRHVRAHPDVSLTVTIAKRIPLLPWIKVPPATVTFAGTARVLPEEELPAAVRRTLFRGLDLGDEGPGTHVGIEVTPVGDFVTYGVGVSLITMRDTIAARGRAPAAG